MLVLGSAVLHADEAGRFELPKEDEEEREGGREGKEGSGKKELGEASLGSHYYSWLKFTLGVIIIHDSDLIFE